MNFYPGVNEYTEFLNEPFGYKYMYILKQTSHKSDDFKIVPIIYRMRNGHSRVCFTLTYKNIDIHVQVLYITESLQIPEDFKYRYACMDGNNDFYLFLAQYDNLSSIDETLFQIIDGRKYIYIPPDKTDNLNLSEEEIEIMKNLSKMSNDIINDIRTQV